MKTKAPAKPKRVRRTYEQLIADLQKQIEHIKTRAEQKKIRKSPVLRHVRTAVASIDKATAASDDAVVRKALGEARATLSACLSLNGAVVPATPRGAAPAARVRRSSDEVENFSERLLEYVRQHPGQRGEEIARALATDTHTMRLPMKKLIAQGLIKTTGERRAMRYFPA